MHFWAKMNGFTAALFIGMVLKMFLKPGLARYVVWNPVLLSGLVCISNVQGTNNLDQIDFNSPCYFLTRGFRYGPAFNKTISREESHVANIQSTHTV